MGKSLDAIVDVYVAWNPHLPFEVLRLLTSNEYAWARNYTTPVEVLEELAHQDVCCTVRKVAHDTLVKVGQHQG